MGLVVEELVVRVEAVMVIVAVMKLPAGAVMVFHTPLMKDVIVVPTMIIVYIYSSSSLFVSFIKLNSSAFLAFVNSRCSAFTYTMVDYYAKDRRIILFLLHHEYCLFNDIERYIKRASNL
jgi:hypothetical protein